MARANNNSTEQLAQDLVTLARSSSSRSLSARFRDVFPQVEAAMKAGVPLKEIQATLARHGLDLKPLTLKKFLQRNRSQQTPRPSTSQPAPTPERTPAPTPKPGPTPQPAPATDTIRAIASADPDLDALARLTKRRKV